MKSRLAIVLLALFLSSCATGRFSAMPNIMASCGMPKAAYTKFHACMDSKVAVSPHAQEGDYYAKSSRELLTKLDDLQRLIDRHKITNKQAYIQLQNYVQQRIVLEQQQAQQAAVAFAVLAGVAAVGICSNNGGCRGGGGGGNNYNQQSHRGCCSWHRGIFFSAMGYPACSGGHLVCNDGSISPSCGC